MAGGEGRRLRPLTNGVPKPMLPIGRKPILEIIIEQLKKVELKDIIIATGYKGDMIKSYFRDGLHFGVNISYTSEKSKLGTAGPLKLLESKNNKSFLVINGDVLTRFNFKNIVDRHIEEKNDMTVGVAKHSIHVPFGIVECNNGDGIVTSIKEKPNLEFLILAGIYVMDSSVLNYVPSHRVYDITELISDMVGQGKKIKYYEIKDKWLDIGKIENYEHAANSNWIEWL